MHDIVLHYTLHEQAEKRVVEAKLEKATATYSANLKKVADGTVSSCSSCFVLCVSNVCFC